MIPRPTISYSTISFTHETGTHTITWSASVCISVRTYPGGKNEKGWRYPGEVDVKHDLRYIVKDSIDITPEVSTEEYITIVEELESITQDKLQSDHDYNTPTE